MIITRLFTHFASCARLNSRSVSQIAPVVLGKHAFDQITYIKSIIETDVSDWENIKNCVLSKTGNVNQKNIDGVLLKFMVTNKKFETAQSFASYLQTTTNELSLGSINGLLALYYAMGKENNLSDRETQFILDIHKKLYEKYKVLDSATCENLIHALCIINEFDMAIKMLDDIYLSSIPSHSAISTLVSTLFKNNQKEKAMEMIEKSVISKRPLQDNAYNEWIAYILRTYKDKKNAVKHMDEICTHMARTYGTITVNTASRLKEVYNSLGWKAQFAKIRKADGQCSCCKKTLDCLKLSTEEFKILEKNIKNKLIVGSDLFLKTSPDELQKFLHFIEKTAPYDIILDALNIAYAIGKGSNAQKMTCLNAAVDYFEQRNKKILILGRKHILKWERNTGVKVSDNICRFFTDNLSHDDPFFITAAILSGPHTDIVSKDLLRGHTFLLKDEHMRNLFKRWQWQHQWMLLMSTNKRLQIQPPLVFTPCAQKKNEGWHLPCDSEEKLPQIYVNDGVPNLSSWLCLTPTSVHRNKRSV